MQPVEPGTTPRFTVREDRFAKTTPSLASYYENGEVEEWIQSVAGVLDQGWNDQCVRRPLLAHPLPPSLDRIK
jgi:actin-like protein 6A